MSAFFTWPASSSSSSEAVHASLRLLTESAEIKTWKAALHPLNRDYKTWVVSGCLNDSRHEESTVVCGPGTWIELGRGAKEMLPNLAFQGSSGSGEGKMGEVARMQEMGRDVLDHSQNAHKINLQLVVVGKEYEIGDNVLIRLGSVKVATRTAAEFCEVRWACLGGTPPSPVIGIEVGANEEESLDALLTMLPLPKNRERVLQDRVRPLYPTTWGGRSAVHLSVVAGDIVRRHNLVG